MGIGIMIKIYVPLSITALANPIWEQLVFANGLTSRYWPAAASLNFGNLTRTSVSTHCGYKPELLREKENENILVRRTDNKKDIFRLVEFSNCHRA